MVLPPPIPPQARSPMGPWIKGGHDDLGTWPERARPRLLWIGYNRRGRATSRQRERKGTIESSERAAARAHEGEPIIEVLSRNSKEDMGRRRLGIWELGRHLKRPACKGWLYRQQAFWATAKWTTYATTKDLLLPRSTPRNTHHAKDDA